MLTDKEFETAKLPQTKGKESMKISTKSWHYRLVNLVGDGCLRYKRMSLCGYFWRVVAAGMAAPFVALVVAAVVIVVAVVFVCYTVAGAVKPYLWALYNCWRERHPRKTGSLDMDPPKPTNLLVAWWRAKKARVCPLIEWVDETPKQGETNAEVEEAPPVAPGKGPAEDAGGGSMPAG